MNLRDRKTQQVIFFLIILVLVLFLFFQFPYKANKQKVDRLRSTRDSLQIEVQKAEAAKIRLPELQAKIARLEIEWERAKEMLPKEKEIPSLIQQISNSGTKAGVSFLLFKPLTVTQKMNYSEIPVQIKVSCGYHQLAKFLSNIGNLARIVNVPSIKIIAGKDRGCEAELSTLTYTVAKGKGVQSAVPSRQ
jgi:type IV pilus assembly protein PilO